MTGFIVLPVPGLGEVLAGDDLALRLRQAVTAATGAAGVPDLQDGDILAVSSKVVAKAEGRTRSAETREAAVAEESAAEVAAWEGPAGRTTIARTRHGLVLANAGVDASNTAEGTIVLLPEDPDASARRLRAALRRGAPRLRLGLLVTDSLGRPWRVGQVDVAVGAAGVSVVEDLRGTPDANGRPLSATIRALGDEIAAAAELVAPKAGGIGAVLVRGLRSMVQDPDGPGAAALVRPPAEDRFALGVAEARRSALAHRRTIRQFLDRPVPLEAIERAVAAAVTAPAPHHTTPWRFVLVARGDRRRRLLSAMQAHWERDLAGDGFDEAAVARRVGRGEVLHAAPTLLVPCLVTEGAHRYPDERRAQAERTLFLLAMGAGIENLLVALAADGLGSAWVSATLFCQPVVQRVLELPDGWLPMGAVAVGYPAQEPTSRPVRAASDFLLYR